MELSLSACLGGTSEIEAYCSLKDPDGQSTKQTYSYTQSHMYSASNFIFIA